MLFRHYNLFLLLPLALLTTTGKSKAAVIVESVNTQSDGVANFSIPNVGWYYTPTTSYALEGVFTRFGIADGRTVTEVIYVLDNSADGATLLRSANFVANQYAPNNLYSGPAFEPLVLNVGQTYFIGFENVEGLGGSLAQFGTYFSDVRYGHPTGDPTHPTIGSYFSNIETGNFAFERPILLFEGTAVPEPSSVVFLLAVGLIGGVRKMRRVGA